MDRLSPRDQKFANSLMIQARLQPAQREQWFWSHGSFRSTARPRGASSEYEIASTHRRRRIHCSPSARETPTSNIRRSWSASGTATCGSPSPARTRGPPGLDQRHHTRQLRGADSGLGEVGTDGRYRPSTRETAETTTAIAAALQGAGGRPGRPRRQPVAGKLLGLLLLPAGPH